MSIEPGVEPNAAVLMRAAGLQETRGPCEPVLVVSVSYRERDMAAVLLKCEIEGCGTSWSVSSPGKMKASAAEHRKKFHPGWVQPEPKPLTPYQLDYRSRARQF
ncbi:MAG TPA: hypothetical protein VMV08_07700 [Gaiellaceae bacterium]|nr:hypothetical protein [Gaiellaceae bacterium]